MLFKLEKVFSFLDFHFFNLLFSKGTCGETTSLLTNQMNFDELCQSIDEQSEFITLFCKIFF